MHIVITGASSGIGRQLAVELGSRGHAVGLIARRGELLQEAAEQIQSAGGTAAWAVGDVLDRTAMEAAVAKLEESHGPTDVMVANAGGGGPGKAAKIDADRMNWVMRLNFEGTVNTFATVLPAMVERKRGHLVAVSSVAGYRGLPPGTAYSAAKAAVTTLCEGFAIELTPHGIDVTTIHPGFVLTPFNQAAKHPLPFAIPVETAGRIMANGIEKRRREVNFPWRMALLMRVVRLLPGFVFEPLYRSVALGSATKE